MEHRGPQREQTIDIRRAEWSELRKIRREHIVLQYRADHPIFNRHIEEHGLSDEQAFDLLVEFVQDPKTGVQRADLLEYTLKTEMHRAKNTEQRFSVAVFDIDNFKEINNELTHVGADDVLKEVAKHIRASEEIVPGDGESVVRWGGEEFVVIFYGLPAQSARLAAEHIRERIANALDTIRPSGKKVTVSGGVTEYQPQRHPDWKSILRDADQQVLLAKESGKNTVYPPIDERPAA